MDTQFMSPKISVSGLRGEYPTQVNEHMVYELCKELFVSENIKTIALARDARPTGVILEKAIIKAASESKIGIHYVGLLPLPTLHLYTRETADVQMGIHITASHNPEHHNGLKILNSQGEFYNPQIIKSAYQKAVGLQNEPIDFPEFSFSEQIKNVFENAQALHVKTVSNQLQNGKKLTIAVDALNSVGSNVVPQFLEQNNCQVLPIAIDLSQPFPHKPEPKPENLVWTQNQLQNKEYDLGVVLDPDADRLVLIDENGTLLSEETTIALIVKSLVESKKEGSVVLNYSTSMMAEYIAKDSEVTIKRVPVGEKNVVEGMKEQGAIFGGEGSGGIIDPHTMYTRDALTGIMHIVNLLRVSDKKISKLVQELPQLHMVKDKVSIKGLDLEKIKEDLAQAFQQKNPSQIATNDGVWAKWDTYWIHVRPSNTEPILRIFSEAESRQQVQKNIEWVKELVL